LPGAQAPSPEHDVSQCPLSHAYPPHCDASTHVLQFGPIVKRQRDKARETLVDALKAKLAAAI